MSFDEWKKEEKRTYDFLDRYDLTEYINQFKGKSVYDLMEFLEDNLDHKVEFPTFLFNVINSEDFADYLKDKYNVCTYEVLTIG